MFSIGLDLNLLSAVAILSSVAVPLYLTMKVEGPIKKLTLLLSAFVLVHAAFHISLMLGSEFIGEAIFDPLSVLILIFFGLSYLNLTKKRKVRGPLSSSSTPSGHVQRGAK
ncbi:MAG: hypothetical protein ABSE82_11480 [Nitrososphaerales archaeon]|jgi:hypothetical protein